MAKAKRKLVQQPQPMYQENVYNFNHFETPQNKRKQVTLLPKSIKQEEYIDHLSNWNKFIVFALGPAGTGKTLLAVLAGIRALKQGDVDKIVITRPTVGVDGEDIGFLPGNVDSKMLPWVKPIMDIFSEYYSARDITRMLEEGTIEITPMMFIRGRTFKNSWIVADEFQNSSITQMKALLTRIGDGSKMVVTGDLEQMDKQFVSDNGLRDFLSRLYKTQSDMIVSIEFDSRDVQRHPVVKEVLALY